MHGERCQAPFSTRKEISERVDITNLKGVLFMNYKTALKSVYFLITICVALPLQAGLFSRKKIPVIKSIEDYRGWSYESLLDCDIVYTNMRPTFSNANCSSVATPYKNEYGSFYSLKIYASDHRPAAPEEVAYIYGCESERSYVLAYERAIIRLKAEKVCK